jgi:hypothetical protein
MGRRFDRDTNTQREKEIPIIHGVLGYNIEHKDTAPKRAQPTNQTISYSNHSLQGYSHMEKPPQTGTCFPYKRNQFHTLTDVALCQGLGHMQHYLYTQVETFAHNGRYYRQTLGRSNQQSWGQPGSLWTSVIS